MGCETTGAIGMKLVTWVRVPDNHIIRIRYLYRFFSKPNAVFYIIQFTKRSINMNQHNYTMLTKIITNMVKL